MTHPRPLREDDTLGRAGRTNANGKPIRAERCPRPSALDERHVATIESSASTDPRVVITERRSPLADENAPSLQASLLPVVQGNGNRGLMHLDGKSEPRPPRDWEAMEAAKRAEIGKSEREALARSLQRDRRAKKLHERIAWLQQRALVAQSQRAVQVRATDAKSAEAGIRRRSARGTTPSPTRVRSRSPASGSRSRRSSRSSRATGTRTTGSRSRTCR
jgi:hypothetical protein